jgi:hypothetical protein
MTVAPRGHRHRGRANNPFFISQQAEWRSRHEGTDIAGKLIILFFISQQAECTDIAGELIILFFISQQAEWQSQPTRAQDCGRAMWMMEDVRKATLKRK